MRAHSLQFRLFRAAGDAGQYHHVDVAQDRFFPDSLQDFDAVVLRKMQIQHNHARMYILEIPALQMNKLQRPPAVGNDLNLNVRVLFRQR